MHGEDGGVDAVLAIATPVRSHISAAAAYDSTAELLERSATRAEQRAELHRVAGRSDAERAERQAARKARHAAERARVHARRLCTRGTPGGFIDAPSVTPRETEVLRLASHGLTCASYRPMTFPQDHGTSR